MAFFIVLFHSAVHPPSRAPESHFSKSGLRNPLHGMQKTFWQDYGHEYNRL
jgi:hypothetical protein